METSVLQERRRLNDEIERTFITTAIYARDIQTFHQTERGTTIIALYENFFSSFAFLLMLTSDLPQLRQSQEIVKKSTDWINKRGVADFNDKQLKLRCDEGVSVFVGYKKVLSEQGVISLPSR